MTLFGSQYFEAFAAKRCEEITTKDEFIKFIDDQIMSELTEFKKSLNCDQLKVCNEIDDLYVKLIDYISLKMYLGGFGDRSSI